MARKLIGRLIILGVVAGVISVVALAGYFYYKSGQPMQVTQAQRLAPGITYQEFWQDRIQRGQKSMTRKQLKEKEDHVRSFQPLCYP